MGNWNRRHWIYEVDRHFEDSWSWLRACIELRWEYGIENERCFQDRKSESPRAQTLNIFKIAECRHPPERKAKRNIFDPGIQTDSRRTGRPWFARYRKWHLCKTTGVEDWQGNGLRRPFVKISGCYVQALKNEPHKRSNPREWKANEDHYEAFHTYFWEEGPYLLEFPRSCQTDQPHKQRSGHRSLKIVAWLSASPVEHTSERNRSN